MVSNPAKMIPHFIKAGVDWLSFHVEAAGDTPGLLKMIRDGDCRAGLALNPDTSLERVLPFLDAVDYILLMSVFPGYGGQTFIAGIPGAGGATETARSPAARATACCRSTAASTAANAGAPARSRGRPVRGGNLLVQCRQHRRNSPEIFKSDAMETIMKKTVLPLLLLLLVIAGGCRSRKGISIDPSEKGSDKKMYENALKYMSKDPEKSRLLFKEVAQLYPDSIYANKAKLGIGDSYFRERDSASLIMAAAEYQEYVNMYPYSPDAVYAKYQIAMCYYQQVRKPERDQTNTFTAIKSFEGVIQQYPGTPEADEAKKKIDDLPPDPGPAFFPDRVLQLPHEIPARGHCPLQAGHGRVSGFRRQRQALLLYRS